MKIAIFGNKYRQEAIPYIGSLLQELAKHHVEVSVEDSFYNYLLDASLDLWPGIKVFDCSASLDADVAFSIGGDGTFLHTAKVVSSQGIPILGINAGHLGYLTSADVKETSKMMCRLLEGDYFVEKRAMLALQSDSLDEGRPHFALNEIAFLRQEISSMIEVEVKVRDTLLTTYKGDGLLVCTPTGSTAYNLSVGGPIIEPLAQCFVLSPVSAHSLTMRPIVMRDNLRLAVTTRSRASLYQVSVDGETTNMPNETTVYVNKAPFCTQVVQFNGHDFADTLRTKLMWGKDAR